MPGQWPIVGDCRHTLNAPMLAACQSSTHVQAHHWCASWALAYYSTELLWLQHWSNRKGWDRRKTLWGSWAVHSLAKPGLRFWFAGDTGVVLHSTQAPQDHVGVSCAERARLFRRGCSW